MLPIGSKNRRGNDLERMVEESSYLTDGQHLFRVLRGFEDPAEDSFALLEDCLTLEAQAFTPEELWRMQMEAVESGQC
jgi:hypothetical protein